MSSIRLKDHGDIPVTIPQGLSEDQLLDFKPFITWVSTLTNSIALQSRTATHPFHPDPYRLTSITVQAFDIFGGTGKVGFLKAVADVSNAAGERLPGSIFLRGPSVAVLVMLIPDDVDAKANASDSDERYAVLTVQPRVPAASLAFAEIPAGMVDGQGSFAGAAAREMEEELGVEIREGELVCLSELASELADEGGKGGEEGERLPNAMYPSAGGCDEHITLYSHERRVPRAQLQDWAGRLTGLREHGEKITLRLVPMRDLWRVGARDAKCLAALALWEGLKREGKI
ncbi:nudix hydrolase [Sodiomyces alkalinus F11]|uniref:Nudix hydrolase n=1 Tax=Sodiomyces alkalinus (strain CBS 110278 / VKM F-3762 / F11) TaxID=1314773 RepID=A0A3N2Q2N2_SODAK|nr:nudix hydrolase [Sodiomyces alkalinus F11]ROT41010.1 nudix hydrolase [Sodiomyces alkalinus F11]